MNVGNAGDRAVEEARGWLARWGGFVAAVDLEGASALFDRSVIGYGTKANEVRGLEALMEHQWRHVWPNIDGFAFDYASADVWVAPDLQQAVLGSSWSSLGRREDGSTFARGGRATVVLRREGPESPWLGVHTHLSLEPIDPGTHIDPEAPDA